MLQKIVKKTLPLVIGGSMLTGCIHEAGAPKPPKTTKVVVKSDRQVADVSAPKPPKMERNIKVRPEKPFKY